MRGCIVELNEEDYTKCNDSNDDSCNLCTDENCNKEIVNSSLMTSANGLLCSFVILITYISNS